MSNKGHSSSGCRSHGLSHEGLVNRQSDSIDYNDNDNEDSSEYQKTVRVQCSYCWEWMNENKYDEHLDECIKKRKENDRIKYRGFKS